MDYIGPLIFNVAIALFILIAYIKNRMLVRLALSKAVLSFRQIYPLLLIIIFVMIFIQNVFSANAILKYLGAQAGFLSYLLSATIGSLVHVPLFVSFPLGGQLLLQGINPGIIGVFITSLIMVHIFTMPIEINEMGLKFALTRNILCFISTIIIGVLIGVLY